MADDICNSCSNKLAPNVQNNHHIGKNTYLCQTCFYDRKECTGCGEKILYRSEQVNCAGGFYHKKCVPI